MWYSDAVRGPDYTKLGSDRVGNPPLETIEWSNRSYGLNADYQIINDLYVWMSVIQSNIEGDLTLSPEYYHGQKTTFNIGVTVGF